MQFGFDLLGGARYPEIVRWARNPAMALGIFFEVDGFGCAEKIIEAEARVNRYAMSRIHLAWDDDHDYKPLFGLIEHRAELVSKICRRYPKHKIYLSGACENRLKGAEARKLASIVKKACPQADYVHSYDPKGAPLPGVINEIHHGMNPPKGAYIYSFDGVAMVDADIEGLKAKHSKALIFFFWDARMNGLWETPKPGEQRPPRGKRKGFPDKPYMESIERYIFARGQVSEFPEAWLYKSHSENKGPDKNGRIDPRAEKPCFIFPEKKKQVEVKNVNGKVIEVMTRFDPPMTDAPWSAKTPGYRYYTTRWGWELADLAAKTAKDPLVEIEGRRIHPCYRQGSFR